MKYIFSDKHDIFFFFLFQNEENRKYGFSIHAPIEGKDNEFSTSPIIFHVAVFEKSDEVMNKGKALIDCMVNNDIDYRNLKFYQN